MSPQSAKRRRPPPSNTDPPQHPRKATRKRATLACEECRVRKRRCDGATPVCGGCMKRMSTCIYASDVQAKEWRNNVIQSLRTRLEELEKDDGTTSLSDHPEDLVDLPSRTTNSPLGHNNAAASRHLEPPVACLSSPQITRNTSIKDYSVTTGPSPVHRPNTAPNGLSSDGGLQPCSVERLMEPIDREIIRKDGLSAARSQTATGSAQDRACFCDRILDNTRCSLPLRRHADRLLDLYFSRVHLVYPVLHQRTFVRQCDRLWQSEGARSRDPHSNTCSLLCRQKSHGKMFPAMLNAVFALASLFESGSPEQNTVQADAFFRQTQTIDLLEILDDEVGIELIQLGLLMGFYLQSTERFSKCWNITGLTIRMAQNIGLQLSLSDARKKGLLTSYITQAEWEMRVRVWYGCVLLDREISMSFGRPLMIIDGGECPRLPEPIDDCYLSDETGKWNTQPKDLPSLLESYAQSIKLYDILGLVLHREERRMSKPAVSRPGTPTGANLDVGLLLSLDSKIMGWRDALPSFLRFDPFAEAAEPEEDIVHGNAARNSDLSNQAKRLYTRFLHVRVLILRPALDLLFHNQRRERPTNNKNSREARVEDLMLADVAAQCVYSAVTLIKFLDAQIRCHTLVAWWYNISYLHTCGSTLLMSRLCHFTNPDVLEDSSTIWDVCLRCISCYTGLNSIAYRSYHLLQDSAKRLLPNDSSTKDHTGNGTGNQYWEQSVQPSAHDHIPQPPNMSTEGIPETYWQPPSSKTQVDQQPMYEMATELGDPPSNVLDSELWGNDADMVSYWSFTPFLSQLETLPPNFDPSHMAG
ncbi:hypothetical protein FE257_009084 [Aspergillus nanangensis]|uniref:Zn(2)-C6 fungal-type domain-containing protein n=1 Tax=Aspergillus nanangensis TaxID=2582783 RepID=A0AAD4CX76_ASPNN|nr:hypothetical protein FE257_009084 [Aspergillus nanangensis]